jgi:ribosomal protein S18 acetylase RimI-like enzyme
MAQEAEVQVTIAVEPATPPTFDALRSIYRETWPPTYRALVSAADLAQMLAGLDDPTLEALRANGHELILVARDIQSKPVAALIGRRHQRSDGVVIAFVWGLYVRPHWQRKGLGRRLMAAIETHIPDAHRVDLSVFARNVRTRAFYQRLGFTLGEEHDREIMPGVSARLIPCTKLTDRGLSNPATRLGTRDADLS